MFTKYRPFEYRPPHIETTEREYEGWIIRGMEDYFRELGIELECVAAGRLQEDRTGVDEFCGIPGKYFALQFKRPERRSDRAINWSLGKQISRIRQSNAIFYVLPTFLNRNLRRVALHHAFFWHPDMLDGERIFVTKSVAAYVHSAQNTNGPNQSNLTEWEQRELLGRRSEIFVTAHAYRWGRFAEGLLSCSIGQLVETAAQGRAFRRQIDRLLPSSGDAPSLVLARINVPTPP